MSKKNKTYFEAFDELAKARDDLGKAVKFELDKEMEFIENFWKSVAIAARKAFKKK